MRWEIWVFGIVTLFILSIGGAYADGEPAATVSNETNSYNTGIIELQTGWNLVGIPRRLSEETNKASVFSGIDSAGRSIWTYNSDAGGWKDLTAEDTLMPLDGYFIYSAKPENISLSYSIDPLQVPPVKDLTAGWNLVGFSGADEASARDSLLSIRKTWTQVIGWDPAKQQTEESIINGGNGSYTDSSMLIPMRAYWVFTDSPCSLASIGA